ncbi:heterokaryon incompatibility protein-domain-containing protein [Echria macrotheca]|uniref:Heterokaryon incompatibility protein-domain-containing protein n=1 Tax=Echria macrotheca TaxID=438768 RepID=A0AAJ0F7Q6_9PEZI|nr:heterokaryon incompatibility protein-domain-containing protein [Echria macrotheca]
MDLKLRFRRPRRKVSRNARAAYQEPSPGQSENQFICPVCGNLDAHHFEPAEGDERLFADAPSLNVHAVELRNASAHCLACRAIIGLLEENLGHFDDEELVVIKAYEKKLVFEMHQPGDLPGGRFELYRHSDSQIEGASSMELWPAVGTARTLVPSFSISDAYPLIASWMDECKSNHAECAGDSNSPLPTRLLAVGAENEIAPYLHETQPNEVGQYIALSHCWGPPEHRPPRTTRGNLGLRRLSIPIEELPPTFSEALQLSRALGIPYLWIDSLCIIQDDAADWEREAARMQEVYRNAVLTISADGAVDSRVGLFKPVSERKLPRSIATCCPAAEVEGATAESESLWGRMTDLNVNMDGMFGWVLSRRIVHFTTGELLWDCLETEGCECQTHFKSRASRSGIRRRGLTDDLEYWGMRDEASHWGMMSGVLGMPERIRSGGKDSPFKPLEIHKIGLLE